MPDTSSQTPSTHYLFLRIIAAVGQSSAPMTVSDLGKALNADPRTIAQCVALHLYLERKRVPEMSLPPPVDYWVPGDNDVISPELLRPERAGRMLAVDAAIRDALGLSDRTPYFSPRAQRSSRFERRQRR
jgi:hypothetical protein